MRTTHSKVTIAIAGDNLMFREGLHSVLEHNVLFTIKASTDSSEDLLKELNKSSIDLCIINTGIGNCAKTLKSINEISPYTKVLLTTSTSIAFDIYNAIAIGGNGFILNNVSNNELEEVLINLKNIGIFSPAATQQKYTPEEYNYVPLTYQEFEYMELCCGELDNREIALRMNIPLAAVEAIYKKLLEKLYLKSRLGIVIFSLKIGLLHGKPIGV